MVSRNKVVFSDFSGTKFQESFEEKWKEFKTLIQCMAWLLAYVLLGSLVYSLWMKIPYEDAMYFSVVTFTTVGYGDIAIETWEQRVFTIFFILFGVCVIATIFLTLISDSVFQKFEDITKKKLEKEKKYENDIMGALNCRDVSKLLEEIEDDVSSSSSSSNSDDSDNDDEDQRKEVEKKVLDEEEEEDQREEEEEEEEKSWKRSRLCDVLHAFYLNIPSLIAIIIPAILIGFVEGWHINEIFYFVTVTATTVGYGDYAPENKWMRLFCIIYLPVCIVVMTRVMGNISGVYLERKAKSAERDFLQNRYLSRRDLNHMDQIYGNGDGEVSYDEFLSFMLVAMKKVDHEDIMTLKRLYRKLDYEKSGKLTGNDVHYLFKYAENKTSGSTLRTLGHSKKKRKKSRRKTNWVTERTKLQSSFMSSDNFSSNASKDEELGNRSSGRFEIAPQ